MSRQLRCASGTLPCLGRRTGIENQNRNEALTPVIGGGQVEAAAKPAKGGDPGRPHLRPVFLGVTWSRPH